MGKYPQIAWNQIKVIARKWDTILLILLLGHFLQSQFNILGTIGSIVSFIFPIKISFSNEAPKITDWLQTAGSLFGLFVASFVWYVWYNFNQYLKIQNKVAGEGSRPVLEQVRFSPDELTCVLKNNWEWFEADNIVLHAFYYSNNDTTVLYNGWMKLADSIPKWGDVSFSFDRWLYQSNIIVYTNRVTDIVHILAFNCHTEKVDSITSIWSQIDWLPSPIPYSEYKKILETIKIKNQAENYDNAEAVYEEISKLCLWIPEIVKIN